MGSRYSIMKDVIVMVSSIITALGVMVAIVQLICLTKEYKKSHEEARRKETVNVIMEWSKSLLKDANIATKIIKDFDKKQCQNLYNYKPFYVEEDTLESLCHICTSQQCTNKEECRTKSGKYRLSGKQLSSFRYYIIRYLNVLECVLIAWQQGIVDREIIEKEFRFLLDDNFENFIMYARNGESYPVIAEFIDTIRKNSKIKNNKEL